MNQRHSLCTLFFVSWVCLAALPGSGGEPLQPVHFQQIRIDGFWKTQLKRLTERWIPHCIRQMEAGGEGRELLNLVQTAKALRGEPHGEYTGAPWSDAYIYNTVESICLALALDPWGDEDLARAQDFLRSKLEEWIPIILAAQSDDGYIHSFHVVNGHPRYRNINSHEFYVQGYFLEMGVAHYRMTAGADRRLYEAARRCADQLCDTFGPEPKRIWIHGHPGMGYALCRLGRLVNEVEEPGQGGKYVRLAKFLLDTRHTVAEHRSPYRQSHLPVVEMTEAVGHAVRATYLYTAMADLAMLTGDEGYGAAVEKIWSNAVDRKHYLTGGVGASHQGEAFSDDFDLRNDGYCESCAGCGLVFWADRMNRMGHGAHPVDVEERVLYNNVLGAIEMSGKNFFYQNPLASEKARHPWHGCPCCVGNIPRALLGIKDRIYSGTPGGDTLFINHFVASDGTIPDIAGTPLRIRQETGYPVSGEAKVLLDPQKPVAFSLRIRIPNRTESRLYTAEPDLDGRHIIKVNGDSVTAPVENGYALLKRTWQSGDVVELDLPMDIQRIHCDERARANLGRVALIRGPLVYNVEDADHDHPVRDLILPQDVPLTAVWKPDLLGGVTVIEGRAKVRSGESDEPVRLVAVPNYARLNRGGWSQVWITEDPSKTVEPEPDPEEVVKPIVRRELDKRTVDRVVIGDETSEKAHKMRGERTAAGVFQNLRWRHAGNGWFSYELSVKPEKENSLFCTYWGSDGGNRRFRLMVDGRALAQQILDRNRPGEFFDVEYALPEDLIRGKAKITVKLEAEEGAIAGGVFDLRIVNR